MGYFVGSECLVQIIMLWKTWVFYWDGNFEYQFTCYSLLCSS